MILILQLNDGYLSISAQLCLLKISRGGKRKQDAEWYLQEDIIKTVKQNHMFLGINIWYINVNVYSEKSVTHIANGKEIVPKRAKIGYWEMKNPSRA